MPMWRFACPGPCVEVQLPHVLQQVSCRHIGSVTAAKDMQQLPFPKHRVRSPCPRVPVLFIRSSHVGRPSVRNSIKEKDVPEGRVRIRVRPASFLRVIAMCNRTSKQSCSGSLLPTQEYTDGVHRPPSWGHSVLEFYEKKKTERTEEK